MNAPKKVAALARPNANSKLRADATMEPSKNKGPVGTTGRRDITFSTAKFDSQLEPEAALSPKRQLSMLTRMDELVREGSQLIIATHSPILMAYPNATIYELDQSGIHEVDYEDTEHYQITRDFLQQRGSFLRHLLKT